MVEPYPEVIDKAFQAMEKAGVTPIVRPIRGGTDGVLYGAALSELIYRRYEFPWKIWILLAEYNAKSDADDFESDRIVG